MDRVNRAMQGADNLDQIVNDVLDAMLSIFDSDRAYLFYPCDPDAPSFEIAMERTRPEYPVRRDVIPTAVDIAKHFRLYLASTGAVTIGPGCDSPLETSRFGEKSKIVMALHPRTGKPWALGMHQCSYARVWRPDEKRLMEEIARRATDVLTSLLAHRNLRESEERHRYILQMAMDGFFRTDMQGRVLEVNEAYCQMSGCSEQELLTMNIADVEALHTAEMIAVNIRRFAEEGPNRFESVHRRKDGSLFDVEISAQYLPVASDQTVFFVRDITERKRAEAEINSLKNYLSNIIDSMPSILIGMDNTRSVTQWNRQAEVFTGIPAGEAIGKSIVHVLPDFAPYIITTGTDMDEHRPSSIQKLLIEKQGERRFYDLMLYPLIVDSVEGAVVRIEDVTERTRIQQLMVQTEKMMSVGGLAAGMAHEINNPLGIITQAAQNIERRISPELHANRKISEELGVNLEGIRAYFDKRQISDAIASIRTAASRAAKIVANMLQFSRRADTTMEFTSLARIVDQALELAASDYDLKKNYDFRRVEIGRDYQDIPNVRIVSVEIEQVILNVLRNAAQAMTANPPDRKPRITIRLCREDRYAVLEVEDNGPGMIEDIRRRVFEPFFTTKKPEVGTGLGLSVSYVIVTQNHKGLMEVQSTPGRGTVFKVRLPIGGSKT
jgi:polar amino acid transport system substrate-binding protein